MRGLLLWDKRKERREFHLWEKETRFFLIIVMFLEVPASELLSVDWGRGMSGVRAEVEPEAERELFEKSLLVIVIDVNPAQKYIRDEPTAFFRTLDSLVTFANAHVLLRKGNEVAFYAAHVNQW